VKRAALAAIQLEEERARLVAQDIIPFEKKLCPEMASKNLTIWQGFRNSRAIARFKDNYFVVYESEDQVQNARPDLPTLERLHPFGVAVTAPGKQADFVSRYCAPSYGIPEDPVTGSTHCSLAPYWSERLKKSRMHARQLSARGGELWCEPAGERVILTGQAVLYMQGTISI